MPVRDFERSPKSTAKDVVDYEIGMLEHCAMRLLAFEDEVLTKDELAFLEAFLLHFRILLEFFGEPRESYPDNLHFELLESYDHGRSPSATALAKAREGAARLTAEWNGKLNKFLAHPTDKRYQTPRSWPVEKMREEMRRLVALWRDTWGEPREWEIGDD